MDASITRKQLLASAGGVAALAVAGSAASALADEGARDAGAGADYSCDVVVAGSGAGGFTAALYAAQQGLNVIVVEVSKTTGGGSSYCGGILYNQAGEDAAAYDTYTEYMGATELGHKYADDSPKWLQWNVDSGLAVSSMEETVNGYVKSDTILCMGSEFGMYARGCREYFDSFEEKFAECGGTLLLETRAEKILKDDEGAICGLQCRTASDEKVIIAAKAVVIATGGFQGDAELRCRYLGDQADMATINGVPYCTGNGLRMCLEAGGSLGGAMSSFSAVLTPAWPAKELMADPEIYEAHDYGDNGKVALYAEHFDFQPGDCIFVNNDGKRYADESGKYYRLPQATIKQKRATGIMLCDSVVWKDWLATQGTYGLAGVTAEQQFDETICSEEVGGRVFSADTLEELADQMNASGIATYYVHKANLVKTVEEYNAAIEAGTGADLEIPRSGDHAPLNTPPYYAYPTRPAIYATWGGVDINTRAQVLDINKHPIPGLYCCAPAAGGIMREVYTGAVGTAGVTGFWAGQSVVEDLAK